MDMHSILPPSRRALRAWPVLLSGLLLVACGDEDPPNPNDCPDVVTEELVACVLDRYEAVGEEEAFRLPLDGVMEACIADQPRDLDGLVPECTARLDIEVNPPLGIRSVEPTAELSDAIANVFATCANDDCLVFSTNFELDFGRKPQALRHDIAVEETRTMFPAPRTWETVARTVTGRPLSRASLEAPVTFLGATGNELLDALFRFNAVDDPTAAIFTRRVMRDRTTFNQRIFMVLTPLGSTDLLQIVDLQTLEQGNPPGGQP